MDESTVTSGAGPGVDDDALRLLVAATPVGLFHAGLDGTIGWVNERFRQITGCHLPLPIDFEAALDLIDPVDRARVATLMLEGDGTTVEVTTELRLAAGRDAATHVRLQAAPVTDADGRGQGYVGTLTDISEMVATHDVIRREGGRYRRLLVDAPVPQIVSDLDGRLLEINEAFCDLMGSTAEALEARDPRTLFHPDDLPLLAEHIGRLLSGEVDRVDLERRMVRADGTLRWVVGGTSLVHDDGGAFFHSVLQDVTERRKAEQALRESEAQAHAVLDSLHEGVVVHDLRRVTTWNAAALEITGLTETEVSDLDAWTRGDPIDEDGRPLPIEERPSVRAMVTRRPVRDVLVGFLHPTRGRRWLRTTATPTFDGDVLTGSVLSFADATEEKVAEDALRASEERYRRLVAHAPMGYLVTDQHGRIVEVNHTIEDIFGVPATTVVGREARDWIHPDDLGALFVLIGELWHGHIDRYEIELRLMMPDATLRWVSVAGTLADPRGDGQPSFLVLLQDITDRRRAEDERERLETQLAHQATHDSLTGLPNRSHLLELLEEALLAAAGTTPDERRTTLERTGADPGQVALLFLDLDRFKHVNDTLGHEAGDELLTEVARRIATVLRPDDLVARLGGDEFVLLCRGVTDEPHARALAQRVVSVVEATPVTLSAAEITMTASVGIALSAGASHPEALLRDADAAMYRAKELGRARLEVFDEAMRVHAAARIARTEELAGALEHDELVVHYQPTIDLRTGVVTAVEALVRWQHPRLGLLAPSEFIGLAEDTGLIVGLGLRVLTAACAEARRWLDDLGPGAPEVHVNLSARQLGTPNLARLVEGVLANTALPPEQLCLEVTESVLMEDAAGSIETLHELNDLGVHLAIDDFGTGYSSLSYLRRFPVDVLKVDRSFVDGLGPDPEDSAIVAAIVNLAATLELRAIAEGVETPGQLQRLRELGCDAAQGYLFSRPVPADALAPLLTRRWI